MPTAHERHRCLQHLAEKSKAGIPLLSWADGEPTSIRTLLGPALRAVEAGNMELYAALGRALSLTDAEQKVVQAAQFSGRLSEGFSALADAQMSQKAVSKKLWLALAYPGFLLAFASLVLPLPRLFTSASSSSYFSYAAPGILLLFVLVIVALIWPRISNDHVIKEQIQHWAQGLPLLKGLHTQAALAQFSITFGQLLKAGIPPLSSLPLALDVTHHNLFVGKSEAVFQRLEKGERLANALESLPLLDEEALRDIAHAEHTGHLEEAFFAIGKRSQKRRQALQLAMVASIALLAGVVVVLGIGYSIVQGAQSYFEQIDAVMKD
ncbi:MAG: hypothetical protein GY822_25410 [Deltaproteobacteria bacterium]|nr:hypothetical protein [Deltaproteobacteria bacterium]